jgi:hypothetical protein
MSAQAGQSIRAQTGLVRYSYDILLMGQNIQADSEEAEQITLGTGQSHQSGSQIREVTIKSCYLSSSSAIQAENTT